MPPNSARLPLPIHRHRWAVTHIAHAEDGSDRAYFVCTQPGCPHPQWNALTDSYMGRLALRKATEAAPAEART